MRIVADGLVVRFGTFEACRLDLARFITKIRVNIISHRCVGIPYTANNILDIERATLVGVRTLLAIDQDLPNELPSYGRPYVQL